MLGEGGMGSVWLAKDNTAKDFYVALKVLNSDALLNDASRGMNAREILQYDHKLKELFLREGQAMKQLGGHSNIVTVFDFGISPKTNDRANVIYYMTLEYVDGENGSFLIEKKVYESDYAKCLKIALKVCLGLSHAHTNGVIHRDVKPSNILIGQNIVKIGDFGLAKILSESTKSFTVPDGGTVYYMAPEQHGANPVTDKGTDIYQFGATLFHIFTGLIGDHHGLLTSLAQEKRSNLTPAELNPRVSKSVSDLIVGMLSKEPKHRPTLDFVQQTLEKEIFASQETRILDRYRTPIVNIRRALKERVLTELDFIKDTADLVPGKKHPIWYATFLLRPLLPADNGQQKLADYFTLIYFAEYTGREITGTSDWDDDPSLTHRRLRISDCCSGLPIRWYTKERDSWRPTYGDEFYTPHVEDRRLQYMILSDVKKARFDSKIPDNLIRANYATADLVEEWKKAVGWDLRDRETKAPKSMSQDIETEIIVPVYCLASGSVERPKNEVLGVVNFEWDEAMSRERRNDIARQIVEHIQKENIFAMTYFTCDVLYNITLPEDYS
jgi:serine/threonine protein kinase